MGWEKRQRGGQYFVMKTRSGDSVVSHYVGKGETAELISQLQAIYRQRAEDKRWREASDFQRPAWEQELDAYCADVRGMFRREMEAAGWYLHRRQWRRGRGAAMAISAEQKKRQAQFMQAQAGDEKAAADLLAQWEQAGTTEFVLNRTYAAYFGYTDARAGKNILLEKAIDQKTAQLHAELTVEDDTPLERLLIERVIVCYHAMNDAERMYQGMSNGVTLTKREHYDRAVDRAQKRYLAAVRELGLARRLRLPTRAAAEEEARLRMIAGGLKPEPVMIKEAS